jgi:AraC-like DNA-binding protein
MRRASSLLLDRNSIAAVTESLGYSSESSFIRAFKKFYGITPHSYIRRRISLSSSDKKEEQI